MARDIARALGNFRASDGFLTDGPRVISWALGHLAQLAEPAEYDPRYRHWKLADLPIIPPEFKLSVIQRSQKQFRILAALLGQPELREVVNACDAGREGELVFRQIYRLTGCRAPVRRLWISSLTEEAIKAGFAGLRPAENFDSLGAAAEARARADWVVGLNATRAYTLAAGDLYSLGRVQTPTLALIVRREAEITAFVPQAFWTVEALFSATEGEYRGIWSKEPPEDGRLLSSAEALSVARSVRGVTGQVSGVNRKELKQLPPMLYDLSDLQREMNRLHGMTAAHTLKAAQGLYETHKAITYPRTDSRYLTPDLHSICRRALSALAGVIGPEAAAALRPWPEVPERVFNPEKVSDHHAIIPTGRVPKVPSPDEERVFLAVARRLAAAFMPPARIETLQVLTVAADHTFVSRGKRILVPGWLLAEPVKAPGEASLPSLDQGHRVRVSSCRSRKSSTKPPNRYTEATLLGAMETAGRRLEAEETPDRDEIIEALKGEGLGTPATRAAIIERLVEVGYLGRHGRTLNPTPKGLKLISMIQTPELASAALTGRWEYMLRQIEAGELGSAAFLEGIIKFTRDLVQQVRESLTTSAGAVATAGGSAEVGPCPRCGCPVRRRSSAYRCGGSADQPGGCGFAMAQFLAGRRMEPSIVADLLTKGRTGFLTGFRSQQGKAFTASLRLEGGELKFEFRKKKPKK